MSAPPPPSPAQVFQILSDTQTLAYVNVLALALFVYDTLLTLDDEIRYIWKQKTNPGTILYHLARYVGLLNTFLNVLFGFINFNVNNARLCETINSILNICFIFGFVGTHGLLTARAYALCGSKKIILVLLVVFFVGGVIPVLIQTIALSKCVLTPGQQVFLSQLSDSQIILVIISDTAVFLITVYQAYQSWRARRSLAMLRSGPNLIAMLFRQGVLRYCFVLVFTVAEAIVERIARPSLQGVLGPLQQTLSILILCRFSLDLRRRNIASYSHSSSQATSGFRSRTGTRTHISWSGMPNSSSTPSELATADLEAGTEVNNLRFSQPQPQQTPAIHRAVEYVHKELVNEFGESSSDLTLVDLGRPSNVGSDLTDDGERSPILPEVDFGEFRWPRNNGLFTSTDIELNSMFNAQARYVHGAVT